METAWAEHPGLAIQLPSRFQSAKLANDVRLMLLSYPGKAIAEPDALQYLLGPSLPGDLSFQLKVYCAPVRLPTALTEVVSIILGPSESHYCRDVLSPRICQPSIHPAVCNASLREPLRRRDLLLCSTNCANPTLRCAWVRRAIYHRDSKVFTAFCPPDHLEHESECL